MHRSRFMPVFLMVCLPLGCASWQSADSNGVPSAANTRLGEIGPSQQIAMDFVNALRQVESLLPAETTVQLLRTSRSDAFTMDMRNALQAAGYAVRWVSDTSRGQLFQYRQEQDAAELSGHLDTYEIAVGSVELRRSYFTDDQSGINPLTPLYVRGADASHMIMDDSHFMADTQLSAAVASEGLQADVALVPLKPAVSRQQPRRAIVAGSSLSVPTEANPLNPLVSGANRSQGLTSPLASLTRVENVFELGQSNFKDVLANHRVVRVQILMFPDDSLRLGDVNKRLVEQMVRSYQPDSDMFSVVGCSLGPTQLESGNAALALGRASRVREALLFAGIPQDRILDEGCWAGDSSDNTLPRRGVVVTLNRQV